MSENNKNKVENGEFLTEGDYDFVGELVGYNLDDSHPYSKKPPKYVSLEWVLGSEEAVQRVRELEGDFEIVLVSPNLYSNRGENQVRNLLRGRPDITWPVRWRNQGEYIEADADLENLEENE